MTIQMKARLAAFLFATLLLGLFLYFNLDKILGPDLGKGADINDFSKVYLATEEIQAAHTKLAAGSVQPANVLTPEQTSLQRIAIVFDGLPNRADTARILDLLKQYDAKAVFFVEGENAADNLETIRLIRQAEQEIGNYTFVGLAELQKQTQEVMVSELCRTQKVLLTETGEAPAMFRGPRLSFTEPLLQAAAAAGLQCGVRSNVNYVPNTLHNDQEADAYVASIAPGSIVAIPIGAEADMPTPQPGKTDDVPAIDKKGTLPAVHDNQAAPAYQREQIIDEIQRLLAALQRRAISVEFVDGFRLIRFVPAVNGRPE